MLNKTELQQNKQAVKDSALAEKEIIYTKYSKIII